VHGLSARLDAYLESARFAEDRRACRTRLVDDCLLGYGENYAAVLFDSQVARRNRRAHLALDHDPGDGVPLAARFLEERGARLSAEQRALLEALLGARPSIYRIEGRVRGRSLTLYDLGRRQTIRVQDEYWSIELEEGNLLGSRTPLVPDHEPILLGPQLPFVTELEDKLVEKCGELLSEVHAAPEDAWREPGRRLMLELHDLWFSEVVVPMVEAGAELGTEEGICRLRFEILDAPALQATLQSSAHFQNLEPGVWNWRRLEPPTGEARITWHGRWLLVETDSRAESRAFEDTFEAGLPGTLTLRSAEYRDTDQGTGLGPFTLLPGDAPG